MANKRKLTDKEIEAKRILDEFIEKQKSMSARELVKKAIVAPYTGPISIHSITLQTDKNRNNGIEVTESGDTTVNPLADTLSIEAYDYEIGKEENGDSVKE